MQLFDYVDREKLIQQIADGMVKEQIHPIYPLSILNYTQKAQYTPELWNEVTDKCRGLVWRPSTGEIVARPFVKFWNYADSRHPETLPENFPASVPTITRKAEAQLLSAYRTLEQSALAAMLEYEGEKIIATPEQRKQFALYAVGKHLVTPILFAMLDGKDYAPIIWKMIRPRGDANVFKTDIDR